MDKQHSRRSAVTLVEVIFAIGVALIGLVGLISVLPVAGRRTQDAVNLNDGAALAHAVFDELKARGLLRQSAWVAPYDFSFASVANGTNNVIALTDSWCIDPLFVASPASRFNEANDSVDGYARGYNRDSGNGYRRLLFPYYRAEQNPLVDPSISTDNTSGGGPNNTRWWTPHVIGTVINNSTNQGDPGDASNPGAPVNFGDFHTRMLRVGLGRQFTTGIQTKIESETRVDDLNGLATNLTKDRTLNATLQGQQVVPGGFAFGKKLTDGDLTWLATCNRIPGTDFMNVSIVILRNRDRGFPTYRVLEPDASGGSQVVAVADEPNKNAIDERLGYVSFASGFTGGAGGTVHIDAPVNTPSKISTSDWVMLSRRVVTSGVVNHIHRWYRIVSVGKEPQKLTVTDPVHNVNREIWRHRLFLDGSDWSFGFPGGDADTSVVDNTYATIMTDIVAVSEHVVLME